MSIIPKEYKLHYPWLRVQAQQVPTCILCHGQGELRSVFQFTINNQLFEIIHCVKDDLSFLSPQPQAEYFYDLYNHPTYFTGVDDMYGLAVDEEKSKAVAEIRLKELGASHPDARSLLEIGCAHGHTLEAAKRHGYTQVYGIEFSEAGVASCRSKQLNVFLGSADDPITETLREMTFDVVASYSVLEHLLDPLNFLQRIKASIEPDGRLVLRVPSMSTEGPWLSLVDHLWHFSEASLRSLLVRAGFEVINVFQSGTFVGLQHPGRLNSITVIAQHAK